MRKGQRERENECLEEFESGRERKKERVGVESSNNSWESERERESWVRNFEELEMT